MMSTKHAISPVQAGAEPAAKTTLPGAAIPPMRLLERRTPSESVQQFVDRLLLEKADGVMLGAMFGNGELEYVSDLRPRREQFDPDWLGRVIPALRDAGLAVHCWMCFNVQDVHRADDLVPAGQYPQWRMRFRPGSGAEAKHTAMCLVCSPYFDRYADLLREIAGFKFDHYWFDGFYFGGTPHPLEPGCWCDHCREGFKADTGLALPDAVDWSSHTFVRWVRWRNDRLLSRARDCLNALREVQPDAECTTNTNAWPMFSNKDWESAVPLWRWDEEIGTSQHAYAWDLPSKWVTMGFKAQLSHDMSPKHADIWRADLPKATCGESDFDPQWHELEITSWLLIALNLGVRPWHYADQFDPDIARATSAAHEVMRVRERTFSRDQVSKTAVLISQNTHDFRAHGQGLARDDYRDAIVGTWMILQASQLPHRFIFDNQLSADELGELDTLILPEAEALSSQACSVIEQWVLGGGHLIVSGKTACSNEWGIAWDSKSPNLADKIGSVAPSGSECFEAGRITRSASDPGRAYCRERDESLRDRFVQAVQRANQPIEVQGPDWLYVSPVKDVFGRLMIHLLNGSPFFPEGDCGFRGVAKIAGPKLAVGSDAHADAASDARGGPLMPIERIRIRVADAPEGQPTLAVRQDALSVDDEGWIEIRDLALHDTLIFS